MNNIKIWPHLTLVAVLCALVAGISVALWMHHEQTVSAEALPNAARIERVDGEVALSNGLVNGDAENSQWIEATPNQPFSVGDRIYTRQNSRAGLAFTGRNFARLNPNTSLDVLSLADRRTQLALRDGSAMFDLGYLAPGELFEVATPYGAVDLNQPGLYNIGIDNGNAVVSVLSGLAQVVGLGGSGQINKGEVLTLLGQTAANIVLSRINGGDAGYLLNDYYGYQYPQYYDGRYGDYNAYLADPYYYDPYRRDVSYQYASGYIPGLNDLDYYGDWQNVSGYGYGWRPRVDSYWAPYQEGYWMTDYPYGPTWVSSEPWGYAPYHYGRWVNAGNQWYWIPDNSSSPRYAPALVAFVPFDQANEIGWVPLGPGDAYAPRYYDQNWQPYYLSRTQNVQPRLVNLDVPGAVTVVPVDNFMRGVDRRELRRIDRAQLSQVRPVLDPLTLTPLRNAAIHSAWGRGKIDLPPGIRKKLDDTTVITSAAPTAPRFRKDLDRAFRVESVPARAKDQKLNFRDERRAADQGNRGVRKQDLTGGQVNGFARERKQFEQQQQRDLQQQQRSQAEQRQRSEQPRGERVAKPVRIQPQREFQVPQARREQKAQRQEWRRPDVPRVQERPQVVRPMRAERQQRAVERPAAPVQAPREQQQPRPMRAERQQKAVERQAAPVQVQRQQPQQKVERQQRGGGEGHGGGKGKGKP
ncbi:MAG TPA: DUF6600 domain-containing protein [Pyrinomonadaceae bacterium]|nr:DUF6600 domain-containing protein [Pyrinomonadaceae bacterium]